MIYLTEQHFTLCIVSRIPSEQHWPRVNDIHLRIWGGSLVNWPVSWLTAQSRSSHPIRDSCLQDIAAIQQFYPRATQTKHVCQ
jgi:hypothetical protein